MKRTTYQVPELRDENDNIIQQGAFGKNTALANSTNDGWIDYVANDLMYLYDNTMGGTGGEINTETITGKTGTITNLTATTVKAGTVTADALNGPLTGNVTGTADKAVADGDGNNIVNTYVTKSAVQGELTNYLPLSGGTLTGVVNGVTPTAGDNSTKIATTEFVNAKAGNYLPLSGGTLTGDVDITGDLSVSGRMTGSIKYVDNGKVFTIVKSIAGNVDLCWNWAKREGAGLALRSTDFPGSPGEFTLFARDANNDCSLTGKPGGSLTWNNKEIERVSAKGTNYIRYESGLQMVFDRIPLSGATSYTKTYTYPVAFVGSPGPLIVTSTQWAIDNEQITIRNDNTTKFDAYITNAGTNSHNVFFISIGRWK